MALTKQQRKRDFRRRFNELLDMVFSAGPSFSLERIQELEEIGRESRVSQRTMQATPRPAEERDILGELIFRKVPREQESPVRAPMTRSGLDRALALAEAIDSADRPEDFSLRGWVEAA
ncbi:hypothetical protein GF318_04695 [Candidatus Micrarchaeota archaeon]|nr:hypothetical protein [Candidatus Micrarchaeota archaeon]